MSDIATKLPEYPVVMGMKGVGPSFGPQFMAEIGDVIRFTHKGAVTAFAGVDPDVSKSGTYKQKGAPTPRCGPSSLRRTLFQVMDCLIKTRPQGDLTYTFIDKECTREEPYYVYMTTSTNRFLRIYYRGVKEHLMSLPEQRMPRPFKSADDGGLFAVPEIQSTINLGSFSFSY